MKDFLKSLIGLSLVILASAVVSPFFVGAIIWVNKYVSLYFYVDYFNTILKFMGVQ